MTTENITGLYKNTKKKTESLSAYSLHNSVKLLRGGQEYFGKLEEMIESSKSSIFLQTYIFDEDETGKRVGQTLINAAKRGVHVYVLVDGYASKNLSKEFVNLLIKSGIRFRRFEPLLTSKGFYF